MRCHRLQKLVPLYSGGELSGRVMRATGAHAEQCPRCMALLVEFCSLRKQLSVYDPPEPSDELFALIRASVHRQIRTAANQPSLYWPIALTSSWRPAVAAMATLVVLLAALAVFRHKVPGKSNLADGRQNDLSGESEITNPPDLPERTVSTTISLLHRHQPHIAGTHRLAHAERHTSGPDQPQPETIALTGIGEYLSQKPDSKIRIEFQTQDPRIRIIWLTPRYGSEQTGSTNESFETESEEEIGETQ